MYYKDYDLMKFDNGFRVVKKDNPDDKFHMIDEGLLKIGDTFIVGPSGYFEHRGNIMDAFEDTDNALG
jgi:hypothetical protein|tara:strand:+ start:273 stop:476 length:204 start_codon:yes stop_codon:yes gene_type:complete